MSKTCRECMEVELFECTHVTFNVFLQIQNGGFKRPNFYIESKKCSGSENPNFRLSGNKVGSKLSIFRKLLLEAYHWQRVELCRSSVNNDLFMNGEKRFVVKWERRFVWQYNVINFSLNDVINSWFICKIVVWKI